MCASRAIPGRIIHHCVNRRKRPSRKSTKSGTRPFTPESLVSLWNWVCEHTTKETVSEEELDAKTADLSQATWISKSVFLLNRFRYEHPKFTYRGHTGPVHIPSHLKEVIVAVLGLDNRPQAQTHFRVYSDSRAGTTSSISYTPPQVAELYAFPSSVDCADQCIGLIELGSGYQTQSIQINKGSGPQGCTQIRGMPLLLPVNPTRIVIQ